MKRIFLIMLVICAIVTLAACVRTSEEYIETQEPTVVSEVKHLFFPSESFEALAHRSAEVVRAEVLDERVEWTSLSGTFYTVYTLHRVRVLEVFQGIRQVGDILDVAQEGGEIDGELWLNSDLISMSPGEELLLFVSRFDDQPLGMPMNPWEGAFRFVDGVWQQANPFPNPDREFTITPEELEALAEYNYNKK